MHSDPDLLPSSEVCRVLDVNRATLTRWVAAQPPRITPALRLPGNRGAFLFHRDDVERIRAEIVAERRAALKRVSA